MPENYEPFQNLALARGGLDRDALRRDAPHLVETLLREASTRVLVLRGALVEVRDGDPGFGEGNSGAASGPSSACHLALRAPNDDDRQHVQNGGLTLYLGQSRGHAVVARCLPAEPDLGPRWQNLRAIAVSLSEDDAAIATSAVALANWHSKHTHCPQCGSPTVVRQSGWVRACPRDGSEHFPRTDPAVIMAVEDDEGRLLLARGKRWGGTHRSVLAGFVEPGESFEQAVARETFEESGVQVRDVRYLGNQPWPFPASLMVGCHACATTTELTPQDGEIEKIAWYSKVDVESGLADGSLTLPGKLSIARALIEHWYGGALPDSKEPFIREEK